MNEKEILIQAMKNQGYTQEMLAKNAGLKRQSNVSEMLRSKSLRVDNFVKLLNTMGYKVIVANKNDKWVVGTDDENKYSEETNSNTISSNDELSVTEPQRPKKKRNTIHLP